ncbi:hypothetical protein NARC_150050 [Candidatus Nitrosocosmicus arcticus]|uniref:Uncharacterized protein n=1 Tax=Candidatus Nitrosocosmicus arcticus TaxID=2035267 RepID=A0A557SS81_9ARCH|nr:hypothetical protein NARC_150050 [Candidatus Nitrosocosmicus arcticus]
MILDTTKMISPDFIQYVLPLLGISERYGDDISMTTGFIVLYPRYYLCKVIFGPRLI